MATAPEAEAMQVVASPEPAALLAAAAVPEEAAAVPEAAALLEVEAAQALEREAQRIATASPGNP